MLLIGLLQDEASKQKKKLARVVLGPSDSAQEWLDSIPQLKKYSMKFADVTGASICAITSEDTLKDLGTVARKACCSGEFLAYCVGV